jgi:hypothetical protein
MQTLYFPQLCGYNIYIGINFKEGGYPLSRVLKMC